MVNQFEAERSQNLVVLLDAGRTMAALAEAPLGDAEADTASPGLTKLDYALNSALVLAYVASLRGDRETDAQDYEGYEDDVARFGRACEPGDDSMHDLEPHFEKFFEVVAGAGLARRSFTSMVQC